jgi:hypothetical protein
MSFKDKPVYFKETGSSAVDRVFASNPNVFGVFVRNKNGNLVVIEAIVSNQGLAAIDAYWLDLEPSYRAAARKKGRIHDRDELNFFDRKAYGYSSRKVDNYTMDMTFRQLPGRSIRVVMSHHHGVKAYCEIAGQQCRLHYIYVHDNRKLIPSVEYIRVYGKTLDNPPKQVSEIIRT